MQHRIEMDTGDFTEYEDVSPGDIFRLPQGTTLYMKTDRTSYGHNKTRTALSLRNGCLTKIEPDKRVLVIEKGVTLTLTVGEG